MDKRPRTGSGIAALCVAAAVLLAGCPHPPAGGSRGASTAGSGRVEPIVRPVVVDSSGRELVVQVEVGGCDRASVRVTESTGSLEAPSSSRIAPGRDVLPDSPRKLFTMGLVTNLLNPKIAVMYLSLIPQFVDLHKGRILLQGFLLGSVQIAVSVGVNLAMVLAAGSIAAFLSHRPSWLKVQRCMMGTVLGALAISLVMDSSGRSG